jgi:hypothetical protein
MPHIYVYTSIRRVRSLGVLQTLFGYSIGNQIAMWMGKKATIGLDVVRTIPTGKPRQYKPWIFLYAVPAGIVTFGLLLFSLIQQLP